MSLSILESSRWEQYIRFWDIRTWDRKKVASKRRLLKISNYQRAYAAFRKRLREARVQADLTQMEAARGLNTRQPFISKCESGERRVDYVELKEFARLYKVPLSYFD